VDLRLPTAPALPKVTNENFGTFSFQRQLSGKPLPAHATNVVPSRKAQWWIGKWSSPLCLLLVDGGMERALSAVLPALNVR
jgi:hypothetical protein